MRRVDSWLTTYNLALTPETTEVFIMARRRVLIEFKFRLGEIVVRPYDSLQYLGVWTERGLPISTL